MENNFAEWGRIGGKKGAVIKWANIPKDQRSELGRKAVAARWAKRKDPALLAEFEQREQRIKRIAELFNKTA